MDNGENKSDLFQKQQQQLFKQLFGMHLYIVLPDGKAWPNVCNIIPHTFIQHFWTMLNDVALAKLNEFNMFDATLVLRALGPKSTQIPKKTNLHHLVSSRK